MIRLFCLFLFCFFSFSCQPIQVRGRALAGSGRPSSFPHRIWAACDFESKRYEWFGEASTSNIPQYPGNTKALGGGVKPYKNFSGLMIGLNPVPGPRMGEVNSLYLRYKLTGSESATFQHFSLTTEDNNHILLQGLTEGRWSEVSMNFSRDARRNDGTPGIPFKRGERMDDLKVFVGKPHDGKNYDLLLDDVIFFSNDPKLPRESEPFPKRVMFLAAFDTGISEKSKPKYWPGDFKIALEGKDAPEGAYWGVAQAVPKKVSDRGKWIRIQVDPMVTTGERTKLRFRYYLKGASKMIVQMFDATVQDNRHIRIENCRKNKWVTQYLDFSRDSRRNDGSKDNLRAGNLIDDIFFFVQPEGGEKPVELFVDEIVLFDAEGSI